MELENLCHDDVELDLVLPHALVQLGVAGSNRVDQNFEFVPVGDLVHHEGFHFSFRSTNSIWVTS